MARRWREAEAALGRRLDRRLAYSIHGNQVLREGYYSDSCSGCTEVPEMTSGPHRGAGCEECGYTGRRRIYAPMLEGTFDRGRPRCPFCGVDDFDTKDGMATCRSLRCCGNKFDPSAKSRPECAAMESV